uniref:Ketoreductase (KR) domain-containing protein n=1 Tax=Scylla olivacea TaxID=85551 RepID=A0A0P4WCZ2_SCYOL
MANPLSRTVMVTGSSRGLGLEIVRQLAVADNPPKVIIATCRNPDKATELQALARDHQQIKVIKFDVVDYKSLPSVVEEVKAAVGSLGLNLLVNNAGIMEKCSTQMFGVPLQDLEPQMFRNVLETNTIAPLMLIKALLPQLRVAAAATSGPAGASRAMVVNISSIMASMGTSLDRHGIYAYRSSKVSQSPSHHHLPTLKVAAILYPLFLSLPPLPSLFTSTTNATTRSIIISDQTCEGDIYSKTTHKLCNKGKLKL